MDPIIFLFCIAIAIILIFGKIIPKHKNSADNLLAKNKCDETDMIPPAVRSVSIVTKHKETSSIKPPLNTLEVKKTIADFFNTNILLITPQEDTHRITLSSPEFGLFNYVDVHIVNSKVNNLEFISHSLKLSPGLVEFINTCASVFGPTATGESQITHKDYLLLQKGLFSRLWRNVWLECGPDERNNGVLALRLTIFSPDTTGKIMLNNVDGTKSSL